ncbi:MAG TPA: DUF2505 domain-containing protein [Sporichthya sp.]|nr:DUF2505 domain-containing protein [Sporichthya sp.]
MATRYEHTITWEAPAAAVYAMITDPAYQEQRSQAGSPVRAESSVTMTGAGATISVFRQLSIDPPGFLKNFVGDSIGIQETQTWNSPTGATLLVEILKQPGDVRGTLRLSEVGSSTAVTVNAEIAVKVPLIGGKVEGYVASILDRLLTKDEEIGREWLAGGGG